MRLPVQRPCLHLMADTWLNDPNGLVVVPEADGGRVWHACFQHNPSGANWGNMSWGHATSSDLVTWSMHPPALLHTDDHACFSGSVVHDVTNTAGFGAGALIAVYTAAHEPDSPWAGRQTQFLAHSNDHLTFTRRSRPVIDRESANFRDPKVLAWRDAHGAPSWLLVAVEAAENAVVFYRSTDLVTWQEVSTFTHPGLVSEAWECPDLLAFEVGGRTRWVLLVSVNPGGIQQGSGTRWFLGDFDGERFTLDRSHESADEPGLWLDWGSDNYASVSFAGDQARSAEGELVVMGWHNNWDYARELADAGFPGMLTLPRRVALVDDGDQLRLRQLPLLDAAGVSFTPVTESEPRRALLPGCGLVRLELQGHQQLTIGEHLLDWRDGEVSLMRSAMATLVPPKTVTAPLRRGLAVLEVEMVLDHGSLELFLDGGRTCLSSLALDDYAERELVWSSGLVGEVQVGQVLAGCRA